MKKGVKKSSVVKVELSLLPQLLEPACLSFLLRALSSPISINMAYCALDEAFGMGDRDGFVDAVRMAASSVSSGR